MANAISSIIVGLFFAGIGYVILSDWFTWKLFFGGLFLLLGAVTIAGAFTKN